MKKLYVGNLPFNASEEQLQEWFGQVGVNPSAISLIRDRFTGQSRGFAFIEIANDEDADRAVTSLNGQNFGGRNLVVNEARPQTERSGGGGGRGGYGGGGGGVAAGVAIAAAGVVAGVATVGIAATAATAGSFSFSPNLSLRASGAGSRPKRPSLLLRLLPTPASL